MPRQIARIVEHAAHHHLVLARHEIEHEMARGLHIRGGALAAQRYVEAADALADLRALPAAGPVRIVANILQGLAQERVMGVGGGAAMGLEGVGPDLQKVVAGGAGKNKRTGPGHPAMPAGLPLRPSPRTPGRYPRRSPASRNRPDARRPRLP